MAYNHKKSGHGILLVIFMFTMILMASTCGPSESSATPTYKIVEQDTIVNAESSTYLYDSTLTQLKLYEGFRSSGYICAGGQWAIGYGFSRKVWEKSTITREQADSILKIHFDKCLKIAEADGLTGNKALAIADFIYNLGEWGYKNSTLRKTILDGKPIDKIITQYRLGGGKVLRGLEKRRAWELKIYNTI